MADMPYWYTGPKQPVFTPSGSPPLVTQDDPQGESIIDQVLNYFRSSGAQKPTPVVSGGNPGNNMPDWYTGQKPDVEQPAYAPSGTGLKESDRPAPPVDRSAFERMLTAPGRLRAAAALPFAAGGDLVSKGVHGALGLEEARPWSYTKGASDMAAGALTDLVEPPVRVATDRAAAGGRAVSDAAGNIKNMIRDRLIAGGAKPKNDAGYGKRQDGTEKGKGYFGELPFHDGRTSTELSIGVNLGGKEIEVPLIVPTLSRQEVDSLLKGGQPSEAIVQKAVAHARERMAAGKSPFAQDGEQRAAPTDENTELRSLRGGRPSTGAFPVSTATARPEAARARRPGATMPSTAFADGQAMPPAIRPAPEDMPQGAFDAAPAEQQPGALAAPTPARPSLANEYRKRVAAVKTEKGEITEADKHKLQMDFFLGLLANNQPGSRFLQNFGKSGQAVSAQYSQMSKEAKAAADKKYGREVDQIFREMGFADKDADNARADRMELADEKRWDKQDIRETQRWKALDAREKQRLEMEIKRYEREGAKPTGHQVLGNGNIGFLMPDGTVKDSKVKAKAPASDTPELERGIESLRRMFPQENNEKLWQRYLGAKRDTTKGDLSDDELVRKAGEIVAGSMGQITLQDAVKQLRTERDRLKGGTVASGAPLPTEQKDLKTGTVYQTSRGPAKWNGSAFEPVK